jgi:hypothetical protein
MDLWRGLQALLIVCLATSVLFALWIRFIHPQDATSRWFGLENVHTRRRRRVRYGFTALHQVAYDGCLPTVSILLAQPDIDM